MLIWHSKLQINQKFKNSLKQRAIVLREKWFKKLRNRGDED